MASTESTHQQMHQIEIRILEENLIHFISQKRELRSLGKKRPVGLRLKISIKIFSISSIIFVVHKIDTKGIDAYACA